MTGGSVPESLVGILGRKKSNDGGDIEMGTRQLHEEDGQVPGIDRDTISLS